MALAAKEASDLDALVKERAYTFATTAVSDA